MGYTNAKPHSNRVRDFLKPISSDDEIIFSGGCSLFMVTGSPCPGPTYWTSDPKNNTVMVLIPVSCCRHHLMAGIELRKVWEMAPVSLS